MKLNYTQSRNDLFAEFECKCPSKRWIGTPVEHIMKTRITLTVYNDDYFFDVVNKEKRLYTCDCGRKYNVQWKYDGVIVEPIEEDKSCSTVESGKIKLDIGQTWISDINPHESFEIYDGVIDTCVDSFKDDSIPFDKQPESTKIYFWKRINDEAFSTYVKKKKGEEYDNTYPYAWCGESKKASIISKIKKNNMHLA